MRETLELDVVERALVEAFVQPQRRARWLAQLASPKRASFLDHLNHCRDLDGRYVVALHRKDDALHELRTRGAPATCRVVSCDPTLDGRELLLEDVLLTLRTSAWGTLVSCIPGRLAYFHDEEGTFRRCLLVRPDVLSGPQVSATRRRC